MLKLIINCSMLWLIILFYFERTWQLNPLDKLKDILSDSTLHVIPSTNFRFIPVEYLVLFFILNFYILCVILLDTEAMSIISLGWKHWVCYLFLLFLCSLAWKKKIEYSGKLVIFSIIFTFECLCRLHKLAYYNAYIWTGN